MVKQLFWSKLKTPRRRNVRKSAGTLANRLVRDAGLGCFSGRVEMLEDRAMMAVITQWNFNSGADANVATGTLSPNIGAGSAALIGGTTATFATGHTTDTSGTADGNSAWNVAGFPAASANNLTAGAQFAISTSGWTPTTLTFDLRHGNTSANAGEVQYTLDRSAATPSWTTATTFSFTPAASGTGDTWYSRSVDLSGISGIANNANVAFRVVSSFAPSGSSYLASRSTSTYASTGTWRFDMVTLNGDVFSASNPPSVPTSLVVTPGNAAIGVSYAAPSSDGGVAISDYEYSTDGGVSYKSAGTTGTSFTITTVSSGADSLVNGTSYDVRVRAKNSVGVGAATTSVAATPRTTAGAPAISGITAGDGQLTVAFTAPMSNGGAAITNYKFSTNGGASFIAVAPAATTSPIVITGLTNGTNYDVQILAVNAAGDGASSTTVSGTPVAPTGSIVVSGDTFSAPFTTTYGTASAEQSFTVSGSALSAPLIVTAPAGFEVSEISGSGFGPSVSFAPVSGSVGTNTVFVRLKDTAEAGAYNAVSLTATSDGAAQRTFATTASGNAVAQKALTVSSAAVTPKTYDGTTAATITGTLDGVVGSDVVTLVGTGTFASANVGTGIAVTSTSTLTGNAAGNYTLTQPTGLTGDITKASQTITFGVLAAKTTADAPFALAATTTSGLAISYVSSNPSVATVSGNIVTIVAAGTTTITASQAGDGNYEAATDVARSLSVTAALAQWTFDGTIVNTSPAPATGTGVASVVGSLAVTGTATGSTDGESQTTGTQAWAFTATPGSTNESSGVQFVTSTAGYENITFQFDQRFSNTATRTVRIQYTLDGSTWTNLDVTSDNFTSGGATKGGIDAGRIDVSNPVGENRSDSWNRRTISFSSIVGASNNANFGVRVVAAHHASTGQFRQANNVGTAATGGTWRFDNVTFTGTPLAAQLATVTSSTAADVATSTATLGGNVTSDGFATVTERGIVYALTATNADPQIGGTGVTKIAAAAGGTGTFTVAASGLSASSGYTFRAYAINSAGTAYSAVNTFTTLAAATAPTVALASPVASGVTSSAATLLATVSSDGGAEITERGFVYAATAANANPEIGGGGATKVVVGGTTGSLSTSLTGLPGSTGYSFKAYATNSEGTTYSDVGTFATKATTTTALTGVSPLSVTYGTEVTFTGTVTAGSGSALPAGTVEIRDGGATGTLLASSSTIGGSGADGTFSIASTTVPVGTYSSIQAFFVPGAGFEASNSTAFGSTLAVTVPDFTPGNLLVLRAGDGTTALGSTAAGVALLEYTAAGVLVRTVPVSASGASALTLRGTSTSEGALSLSGDRQFVTFGGHRADAGSANPNTAVGVSRVIGVVSPSGAVNTSQAFSGIYTGDSLRSVVTNDGTQFWMSGATGSSAPGTGGVRYVASTSATEATALELSRDGIAQANANTRQIQIIDGNLFVSAGSNAPGRSVFQVGTGLPTTSTQPLATTFPVATNPQYQAFVFADLSPTVSWNATGFDTLYATDSSGGNLVKFSFVGGTWSGSGSIALTNVVNLAGFTSGSSVVLYVTQSTVATGGLKTLTDTTGYNADFSSLALADLATPVTAGANYALRGITFVPRTGVSTTTTVTGVSPTSLEQGQEVTFTATVVAASGTATPTGSVLFRSGNVLLGTAALSGTGATGTATVTSSSIPFGTYENITAQYVPDGNPSGNLFNPSTSAAFGTSLVITQPGVVTTTTLTGMTPTTVNYGESVTFTGAVAPTGGGTPAGTLEIRDGGPTGRLLGSTSTFGTDGSYTVSTSAPIPGGTYANIAAYFVASAGFKNSNSETFATPLNVNYTALGAGAIAFTGMQGTGTDKVSFVLLQDVIAGTTITISDAAWTGTALLVNEGTSTITFTQAFTAGTIFDYDATRGTGVKWQHGANTQNGGQSTGLSDVTTASFTLNSTGENLFAYQGAVPTSGVASGWIAAFSTNAFLTEGAPGTDKTWLPDALSVAGGTAFSLNWPGAGPNGELGQNAALNDLGTVTDSASGIRSTVYTVANWTTDFVSAAVPSGTVFVVGSAATPTIGTEGTLSGVTTVYGTASGTTTITVTGSDLSADITASAPAGFEVSSDGTTFSTTAAFSPTSGAVSGTLYVRLAATTSVGTYSGDVTFSSTGATNVTAAMPSSTVSAKELTITGLSAAGKTYDGTTTASLSGTAALFGVIGSDDVSLTGTGVGAFNSKDVNAANAVSVSGFALLGSQATNYTLTQPSLSASITAKPLTVRADNKTKVVNAANPTLTATIMGFVSGETAATAVTGAAELSTTAVQGSAVGSYPITVGTGTLAATGGNYTFSTLVDGTLAVTNAPVKVTGVYVRGTTSGSVTGWNTNYLNLSSFTTIGTDKLGWQLRDGANQLTTSGASAAQVTWNNVNTISVKFDQAISTPQKEALKLVLGTGNQTITPSSVSVLASGTVAQFVLPAALASGKYVLSIASTGITDAAGTTVLDGEWTASTSTFASGSGTGVVGGMFNFAFNVLVGDVNANGTANSSDVTGLRSQILSALGTAPTATTFRYDLNGSNVINSADQTQLRSVLTTALGTAMASLAAATAPAAVSPTIGSPTSANVTATGARLGGTVTSNGGEPVLERGIVLLAGETGTPDVTDPSAITLLSVGGSGLFTVDVTGLAASTSYRFRAFVRTSQGVVYGDVATFTTLAASV